MKSRRSADKKDDEPRTVIITGASQGLGLQCALNVALAYPRWHLVLACRAPLEKADAAAESVRQRTGHRHVEVVELDLASLQSVRHFAAGIAQRLSAWGVDDDHSAEALPPLASLICNAGLQVINPAVSKDGFELTFATNHLGHFLLVNMLLRSVLVDSVQGKEAPLLRIVSVASGTHDPAKKTGMPHPRYIKADWLAHPERDTEDTKKDGRCTYTTSKLCNVLFTYELARRLKAYGWEDRVHVTAYDPGFMPGTGLARDYPAALRWIFVNALPWASVFMSRMETPERSGAQLARLATDPAFAERTNQYFVPSLQDIPSSEESYDEAKQADLWATSTQLAQLTAEETPFGETDENWMKGH